MTYTDGICGHLLSKISTSIFVLELLVSGFGKEMEEPYIYPWKCPIILKDQPSIPPKASTSCLQALSCGVVAPTLSQLPKAWEKGDSLAITIPEDVYKGIQSTWKIHSCKRSKVYDIG